MANLYLREDLPTEGFRVGANIEVHGDEARHAVTVSRLGVGEHTVIGNGRGVLAQATVTEAHKAQFTAQITHVTLVPPNQTQLVLVQALAKGDRDERAVEQATEFGVDAIVPWQASRSVSRWLGGGTEKTDRAVKGQLKWAKIAREASKQSMRAWVAEVRPLARMTNLIDAAGREGVTVLVLHPGAPEKLSEWANDLKLDRTFSEMRECDIVIGPEGGLSDDELASLASAGAHVLSLGDTVLRTSSAGPAALAILNAALKRW